MNDATRALIDNERARQHEKWGAQIHHPLFWQSIALEEFGEVAQALIEGRGDDARTEVVQLAAVLTQWLEAPGGFDLSDPARLTTDHIGGAA